VVTDLFDGQYNAAFGVFCFNIAEGWSRDGSADIRGGGTRTLKLQQSDVPSLLEVCRSV
jgi:hypothetical protein